MREIRLTEKTKLPGAATGARIFTWGLALIAAPFTGGASLLAGPLYELQLAGGRRRISAEVDSREPDGPTEAAEIINDEIRQGSTDVECSYEVDLGDQGFGRVTREYHYEESD